MLTNRLSLLALAFAGTNAAILNKRQSASDRDDYLESVCYPTDATGQLDWNAPCNALRSIQYECMYGPRGGELIRASPQDSNPQYDDDVEEVEVPGLQPNDTQRVCYCQSQFRDMMAGCMKCNEAHGGVEGADWFSASTLDPVVEKYCDADTAATEGFDTFFYNAVENVAPTTEAVDSETATVSDPIGNATDVSLYFTASVTGSAAYVAAMPTPESSGGNVTYTSTKTSDGQIVPTAVGDERETSSGSAQSSQSGSAATTAADSGAVQTAMAQAGVFGALGFAALIAAL